MIATTHLAHRRTTTLVLALALILSVAGILARDASAGTQIVRGRATFAVDLFGCSSPIGLCYAGTLTGDVQGNLEATLQGALPSLWPLGVLFYGGDAVIRTTTGDLFCGMNVLTNESPFSVDGEWVGLCVISGGTGRLANASGYLQFFGTTNKALLPTLSTGKAEYRGKIITP